MQRTILLTGASRGLGRELLLRFLEAGHRVLACARSRPADLPEYPDLSFAAVDVGSDAAVRRWIDDLLARFDVPDLVINNAALMNDVAPLWEVSAEEFDDLLRINVSGMANVVRAVCPAMIAEGRGVIVNLSSGWGRSTAPEVGPYCASKWAVEGFSGSLAQELPAGLACVPLNPGVIDTDMLRQCWADGASSYEGPAEWSRRAAPFLLDLGPGHNGQALTVPS